MLGTPVFVAAALLVAASPDPSTITGGSEVDTCGWPSAVEVFVGPAQCSGVLVHPQVVVLTDACPNYSPAEGVSFAFRDEGGLGGVDAAGETCQFDDDGLGFCILSRAVAVPYAPILFGCEHAQLDVGTSVTLVGYGTTTEGVFDHTKRYGEATVAFINDLSFTIEGDQAPCVGDTGAPAFVRLDDGSWRVAGLAQGTFCNNPTTISDLGARIEWLETESGFDLTPCHDAEGLPDPSPACAGFYAGGAGGQGDWGNQCAGAPVGGDGGVCSGDLDPPSVSIAAPLDGSEYDDAPATLTIEVDAEDGDGLGVHDVRLEVAGMLLPTEDREPPYAFVVELPLGEWPIVAVARDWGGGVTMSTTSTLWVGVSPASSSSEESGDDGDASTSTGAGEQTSSSSSSGDGVADTGDDSTSDAEQADDAVAGCGCNSAPDPSPALPLLCTIAMLGRRRRPSATRK